MNRFALILSLILAFMARPSGAAVTLPQDSNAAIVLVYFHITDDDDEGALNLQQFEAQLREIADGPYTVLPLSEIAARLNAGESLPPGAVALSFEGLSQDFFANALPILTRYKMPFTVFYTPGQIESTAAGSPSWADLEGLARNPLATLGVLPSRYVDLTSLPPAQARGLINTARQTHREHFGSAAPLFAWPYGLYTPALQKIAREAGFINAFGQQSGVLHGGSDPMALPRFPQTDRYANVDRFVTVLAALPLPARDFVPAGTRLESTEGSAGFTVGETLAGDLSKLRCFVTDQEAPKVEVIGTRVEIRLSRPPQDDERLRLNCTMPGPAASPADTEERQRWRWLSLILQPPLAASSARP